MGWKTLKDYRLDSQINNCIMLFVSTKADVPIYWRVSLHAQIASAVPWERTSTHWLDLSPAQAVDQFRVVLACLWHLGMWANAALPYINEKLIAWDSLRATQNEVWHQTQGIFSVWHILFSVNGLQVQTLRHSNHCHVFCILLVFPSLYSLTMPLSSTLQVALETVKAHQREECGRGSVDA